VPKLQLAKRERIILGIGVVAVLTMGVYFGAQGPWKKYQLSVTAHEAAVARLDRIREWHGQIVAAQSGQASIEKRLQERGRFDLYSHISRAVQEAQLKEKAKFENMASTGRISEVRLTVNSVSLDQLVNLMYRVYEGDNLVGMRQLDHIRAARDGQGLACSITFFTPTL